jgi:hypothetical protein
LRGGDRDNGGERPHDQHRMAGQQEQQHVGGDGLGAFGQAADEPQRPLVAEPGASSFR